MWQPIQTADPDMKEGLFARRDATGEWCVESYCTVEPPKPSDPASPEDDDLRAVTLALSAGATWWQPLPAPPTE